MVIRIMICFRAAKMNTTIIQGFMQERMKTLIQNMRPLMNSIFQNWDKYSNKKNPQMRIFFTFS